MAVSEHKFGGRFATLAMIALVLTLTLASTARAAVDQSYHIHGGDQLNVVVYGEQSLTGPVTVLPDGTIDLALVGKVHVAGQSPDQASQTIRTALGKYLRHPVVTVAVAQVGQVNVTVLGGVKTPGKYALPQTGTLTDALAAAGGLTPIGSQYPDAKVGSPGGQVEHVSLEKLLHQGDTSLNVLLQDGSIVYIPSPVTIGIKVVGSVDHPGELDLHEGDRLSMAIAMAGTSALANSDLNNITVTRTMSDGKTVPMHVNLYKTLVDGDLSKDLVMEKGDLVYVPAMKGKLLGSNTSGILYYLLGTVKTLVP
jgi:polysaccharide export outer membrane protein